jgi:hypothetical protein
MLILDEGRSFPSTTKMRILAVGAGAMALLSLVCILLMFFVKKHESLTQSPSIVDVDSEAEGLGRAEGGFSGAALGRGMIFGSIATLMLIAGCGVFILTHTKPEELVLGFCMVGALMLGCLVWLYFGVRRLGYRLALFENGLVESRGKRTCIVRWADVDAIRGMVRAFYRGGPVYMGGPMVIRRRDGATVTLGQGIQNLEGLAGTITERVMAHLLPAALHDIRSGGKIDFDTLQVDAQGLIRKDGARLGWGEFGDFAIMPDSIQIQQTGAMEPWWKQRLSSVWNARLLLDLAAHFRGR